MSLSPISYTYKAALLKAVDGDTVDLSVDLGFYMSASLRFRLLGVDTPELRGGTKESKEKAKAAKAFVIQELENSVEIWVTTQKADSFGRWLGDINYQDSHGAVKNLSGELVNSGHGVVRFY